MLPQLYLLRHPPVAVDSGICYGRSDVPLRDPVDMHLAFLAPLLPPGLPIFSSPRTRCLALARALGEPHIDPRLAEMDFGAWEMRRYDDIPRQAIDDWARDPMGFRPPGGECGHAVRARSLAALDDILRAHATALIVSHGGPLRCIAGHLLALEEDAWLQIDIPPGALCVLERRAEGWRLARLLRPAHSMADS